MGIWELDHRSNGLEWSDEIYRIFEFDPDRFTPRYDAFLEAVHPEDRPLVGEAFWGSVSSGEPYDIQYRLLLASGRIRWIRACGTTKYDDDGAPELSTGVVQDVTDQVETKEQLARANARLDREIEQLRVSQRELEEHRCLLSDALVTGAMGAWFFDVATSNFRFTEEFFRVLRSTPEAEGGLVMSAERYAERFIPATHRGVVTDEIRAALGSDEGDFQRSLEHPVNFADGTRGFIQVSYRTRRDASGRAVGLVGINQDITEQRRQFEDLAHQRHRLEELNQELAEQTSLAQKLAKKAEAASVAKSTFLANMSHEIRTPMNGVLGMTELLLEMDLGSEQKDAARTIYRSAESLLSILDDILDFSKVEAGHVQLESVDFDLESLVYDVVDLFSGRLGDPSVDLLVRIRPGLRLRRRGDPARIRQILSNLVGNAMKFTSDGHVSLAVDGSDDEITLEVSDTGMGIPTDRVESIFAAFSQGDDSTARRFGGTGLGLSICRWLTEAMGGHLGCTSQLGEGSTFSLRLPLAASGESVAGPGVDLLRGTKLLSIDANPVSRAIVSEQLRACGADVAAFAHLDAAPADLRIDAALFEGDAAMLENEATWSKVDAAPTLRSVPRVLLTARQSRVDPAAVERYGFRAMVSKTSPAARIATLLRAVIDGVPEGGLLTPHRLAAADGSSPSATDLPVRLRVLLAEDNAINEKIAHAMLDRIGCEVSSVPNGLEAVQALRRDAFDLVLMDCQMPEMDGFEATRVIRADEAATGSHTPIIALTANASRSDRQRCLEAGMDDHVSKPIRMNDIRKALKRWSRGHAEARHRPIEPTEPPLTPA